MNEFKLKTKSKILFKNVVILEGLPGIGNVGKIAIDYLIDSLKAKKIYEIKSCYLPNCVFVEEDNTLELPKLEIYHYKFKSKDFLFISGDAQPTVEMGCYKVCEYILDLLQKRKIKEIITLGGVGLEETPKKPKVYCSVTNKKAFTAYSKFKIHEGNKMLFGPIVGVAGVLLGLARERNIFGVNLLVETSTQPSLLGIKGAQELIKIICQKFGFKVDLKNLNKEVKEVEKELKKKVEKLIKKPKKIKIGRQEHTNYIG